MDRAEEKAEVVASPAVQNAAVVAGGAGDGGGGGSSSGASGSKKRSLYEEVESESDDEVEFEYESDDSVNEMNVKSIKEKVWVKLQTDHKYFDIQNGKLCAWHRLKLEIARLNSLYEDVEEVEPSGCTLLIRSGQQVFLGFT